MTPEKRGIQVADVFSLRVALWSAAALLASFGSGWAGDDGVIRLSEPVEATDAYETFGAPLPAADTVMSLAAVIEDAERHADTDVQITTKVRQVCQKKGCFFVAQDGPHVARVSFKDYGFFVPTDIAGRMVTLHGVLKRRELTEAQAGHFSEDAGRPGAFKAGPQYEFVAISVRIPRANAG